VLKSVCHGSDFASCNLTLFMNDLERVNGFQELGPILPHETLPKQRPTPAASTKRQDFHDPIIDQVAQAAISRLTVTSHRLQIRKPCQRSPET
jgi:hypothetical protein